MDVGVLLENKLSREWSAPEFASFVTADRLRFVAREFATLQLGIKVRVLLALLSLPVPQLQQVWAPMHDVLRVAAADPEAWVQVALALVRKRLPPKEDVVEQAAVDHPEQPRAAQDTAPSAAAAAAAADAAGAADEDRFVKAVRQVAAHLERPRQQWPVEGDVRERKRKMSPEFVPLEWPFLCREVLPTSIEIEDTNRYFTLASDKPTVPTKLTVRAAGSVVPPPPPDAAAATVSAVTESPAAGDASAEEPIEVPDFVPEKMRDILRDPANAKLDNTGRRKVAKFYSKDADRPASGTAMVLLAESREYVDENTAILVTQTYLKLVYETNPPAAKRVKTKKKLKYSATPASPPAAAAINPQK